MGRWIPTIAVDQFAVTLATGVGASVRALAIVYLLCRHSVRARSDSSNGCSGRAARYARAAPVFRKVATALRRLILLHALLRALRAPQAASSAWVDCRWLPARAGFAARAPH
jgi:hypothetical protein